jgi:hypothetical protein
MKTHWPDRSWLVGWGIVGCAGLLLLALARTPTAQGGNVDGDTFVLLPFKLSGVDAPDKLTRAEWDYLQRFVWDHEGPVPFLYNDGDKKGQDGRGNVTYGVGILLEPRTAVTKDHAAHFYNRKTGQAATVIDLQADYDFAAKTPRGKSLDPYAKGTVCRLKADVMADLMANTLKAKLAALLLVKDANDKELIFAQWDKFPSTAKIAMVSYAYGMLPTAKPKQRNSAPKLLAALHELKFDVAAKEISLSNLAYKKNKSHEALLLQADRVAKGAEVNAIPDKTDLSK